MRFEFREGNHTFWLDGERIPGVTEILRENRVGRDHTYTDPYYRERGSAVHMGIKLGLLGRLDRDSLNPEIAEFVDRALGVVSALKLEPVLIEQPLFDPVYRYAGIPDMAGRSGVRNRAIKLDFKTGPYEPAHKLQLQGGYSPLIRIAAERGQIDLDPEEYWRADELIVCLNTDPPKVVVLPEGERSTNVAVFREALAVLNWRKRNGYA